MKTLFVVFIAMTINEIGMQTYLRMLSPILAIVTLSKHNVH